MKPLEFFVPGTPKPAGSKTAFTNPKTGKVIITDASGAPGKAWRKIVTQTGGEAIVGRAEFPLSGALVMGLTFFLQRPMNHHVAGKRERPLKADAPVMPTVMPDATKLTRAVEDALTKIVWLDDAQIVQQSIGKCYCNDEYPQPGVLVWVGKMEF